MESTGKIKRPNCATEETNSRSQDSRRKGGESKEGGHRRGAEEEGVRKTETVPLSEILRGQEIFKEDDYEILLSEDV